MRWSQTLIPTLRQTPVDATARSHVLMLRAGLVRAVGSGAFTYLPLGLRALQRAAGIVREEMDRAGAVEVLMPILWPAELMRESGRLGSFGDDLVAFADRSGRDHVLAPTHEETATAVARDAVRSYRQLPVTLYQIQTKVRDEVRPRLGAVRTREFLMKDAYSFCADAAQLDECYGAMRRVYERILRRCGLPFLTVEADPGVMGGDESHEFIVPCDAVTADYVECPACGYAANQEAARCAPPPPEPERAGGAPALREVDTPAQTTIEQVSAFLGVPRERLVKTIVYVADARPVGALVRGDHEVNEAKLRRALGAESLKPAGAGVIEEVTGAPVGFAGPVGWRGAELVVDAAVARMAEAVTGANRADAHMTGVVPSRDFPLDRVADVRRVREGDPCPACGGPMRGGHGMEVAHAFRLGTKYSLRLGATYLSASGERVPYVMGCYGIGVNRLVAAAIEVHADKEGIVWPPSLAPYEALVLPLDMGDRAVLGAAEAAYAALRAAGVETLLDDRDERPGVKFHDADLLGFPMRLVVGKGFLRTGHLEMQRRRDQTRADVAPEAAVDAVRSALTELTA